jgi:hypothetical protein
MLLTVGLVSTGFVGTAAATTDNFHVTDPNSTYVNDPLGPNYWTFGFSSYEGGGTLEYDCLLQEQSFMPPPYQRPGSRCVYDVNYVQQFFGADGIPWLAYVGQTSFNGANHTMHGEADQRPSLAAVRGATLQPGLAATPAAGVAQVSPALAADFPVLTTSPSSADTLRNAGAICRRSVTVAARLEHGQRH